jgi:hypothetical protein
MGCGLRSGALEIGIDSCRPVTSSATTYGTWKGARDTVKEASKV